MRLRRPEILKEKVDNFESKLKKNYGYMYIM